VVKDVDCETIQADDLGELADDVGQAPESVAELVTAGGVRESEARKVRRDNVVAVSQRRNQVAEHVRRRRKAVQQQNGGGSLRSGLAVKDRVAVNRCGLISD